MPTFSPLIPIIMVALAPAATQSNTSVWFSQALSPPDAVVQMAAVAEAGSLQIIRNVIRYGHQGSLFHYEREGGQDILTLFQRYSLELQLFKQHTIIFLFQPFTIVTRQVAQRDLQFVNVQFTAGTPLDILFGFNFFRLAYQYDFFADAKRELAIGASLQVRNAQIAFTAVDGQTIFNNDNLGLVPLLRARGRYRFADSLFLGVELDGIYAPISRFNGGNAGVTGALLDGSLRAGWVVNPLLDVFLNVRYLGGGFSGPTTGIVPLFGSDNNSEAWLQAVIVSLGFAVH